MPMTTRYTVIDGEVLAQTRNGVRHHYVPDPSGNVIALYDTNQTKTDTFEYWPYGEQKSRTGTTETPFRFGGALGYYRDTDRWSYVRARYYRPDHGRWHTADPVGFRGMDANLYRYVWGSPVTWADPWGLQGYAPYSSPGNIPGAPQHALQTFAGTFGFRAGGQDVQAKMKPIYGKYCGPQSEPGEGEGIDDLDNCCKAHDECWAKEDPPCTYKNQLRPECRACTATLCTCAKGAQCKTLACKAARLGVMAYACSVKAPPQPQPQSGPPRPIFGGLPKAGCPKFPAW